MIAHTADWVLAVSQPPIRDGAVLIKGDRIHAVGPARAVLAGFDGLICAHGAGAILPGLVNCHVHLEFAALAGKVPPQERWEDWLEKTLAAQAALSSGEAAAAVGGAIAALHHHGTILVGEVTNTGLSLPDLQQSPLAYHLFYECLGFNLAGEIDLEKVFPFLAAPAAAAGGKISAGVHAPYSVSPALFHAVHNRNTANVSPQTVHLAECRAEVDFLIQGNGVFQELLQRRGRWVADFKPPAMTPAAYLHHLDFLGPRTLAVHGTWLTVSDCLLLAATGTWLVLCPRANRYTGAGTPPVLELLAAGVDLALGTDSLAGNWDSNLFGELLWLRNNFPSYPGEIWLRMATLNGAKALGRDQDLGSLAPGKIAALGFVPLPPGEDLWAGLFAAGAAGRFRWLG